MDRGTEAAIRKLTDQLVRVEGKADQALKTRRAPQLGQSSIDSGAMEIRDPETQATRVRIGWIDGAAGIAHEGGEPVSAPTAPSVTPSLGGLRVTWDGALANELSIPVDFDHMAVHISTSAGFEPSAATFVGTIRRAGEGGMLPVVPLPYVEHYVVLVPVTTGGVQGTPSAEVSATPLQTSGVDLEADSVAAVHLQAGAVEADKLSAVLALVTTIIAGIPGAARVELDQDGMRGYNADNQLIFAIDSAGNAVFSGDITGSLISGSRMVIGESPGAVGEIKSVSGQASVSVSSPSGMNAQILAQADQAEFSVYSDEDDATAPAGGFVAIADLVQFALNSDNSSATTPGVAGTATPTAAYLYIRSQRNSTAAPRMDTAATSGEVYSQFASGDGAQVLIRAVPGFSAVQLSAPPGTVDPDTASGSMFGQRISDTAPSSLSIQSPKGAGYDRRSILDLRSANVEAATTTADLYVNRLRVYGETVGSVVDTVSDGALDLYPTHSILSVRHRPVMFSYLTGQAAATADETWTNFTALVWERGSFKTGASGLIRVTIAGYLGLSSSLGNAYVSLGYAITGIGASRLRSLEYRAQVHGVSASVPVQHSTSFLHQLDPDTVYDFIPQWIKSTGTWGSTISMGSTVASAITIDPLT